LALVVAWLPPFLTSSEGYSAVTTSWLVAAAWMIEAAAVIGVGWYSASLASRGVPSRLSRGYLAAGLICLSGLSLLLTIGLPTGVVRTGALILGFAAAQAVWPLLFALISEIVPVSRRGSVISIFTAIFTPPVLSHPHSWVTPFNGLRPPTRVIKTASSFWARSLLSAASSVSGLSIRNMIGRGFIISATSSHPPSDKAR
jgi:hypothetical protein